MATRRPQRSKKFPRTLLVVAVLLVLVGAVAAGLELRHRRTHTVAQTGPTPAQKKQEADSFAQQKEQAIEHPTTPTPSPTPTTSTISLSTHQESNGTVTVYTNLGKLADGSCTLTVQNGSATNSQTADVLYQPQYSSCEGFSVPISSVGSGTWTLKLSVTSAGTTVSQTITSEIK